MAYKKFRKLQQLTDILKVNHQNQPFLPTLKEQTVSERLLKDLADAAIIPLSTEKSKSEHVIAPILKELLRNNLNRMSYFSGFDFNVDSSIGLSGFCDYILSAKPRQLEIAAPIFCLVEAKNAEIKRGLAQCGAEMYAAKLFNEQANNPRKIIYGCVTNAFSWAFLQLENDLLTIDPNYVPLTFKQPNQVLTVLQWVLDESLKA